MDRAGEQADIGPPYPSASEPRLSIGQSDAWPMTSSRLVTGRRVDNLTTDSLTVVNVS